GQRGRTAQLPDPGGRHGPQATVNSPVPLHGQEVVDVFGVEVARPEHVVVALDAAESAEYEVGAGQHDRQGAGGAAHVRLAHQGVVARAGLQVAHHGHHVLGHELAQPARHGRGDAGAVYTAV